MYDRFLILRLMAIVTLCSGCATLPSGTELLKKPSYAFAHPEQTRLGKRFEQAERDHQGESGFRIIQAGADGFLMRMQMIAAAERTLDLQYFILNPCSIPLKIRSRC